ncbi:MAG TPA: hypothetical protein VHB20_03525 [Verrucomicrobiae bacterium]|nr:hypothetical protein [Verrucomicrobiae bacterium]
MPEINAPISAPAPLPAPRADLAAVIGCAVEAATSALVVSILGQVALSIAGAFAGGMIPTPPPLFGAGDAAPSHHWHGWSLLRGHALYFFFAIFFAHSLWGLFRPRPALDAHHGGRRRVYHILYKVRENWFRMVIGNAITAYIAVVILASLQNFSLRHLIWNALGEWARVHLESLVQYPFGPSQGRYLSDLFSWYGSNAAKLNFWFVYITGVFDDLGVPNFKTLACWLWRRYRKSTP